MSVSVTKEVELLSPAALKAAARNARTHTRRQIRQIADAIERFGFTSPLLIDDSNVIVAGHGRLAAAKLLKLSKIPCIRIGGMTVEEKRAYAISDNQLALKSGWDTEVLALEFQELIEAGFNVESTGFDLVEIDQILIDASESSAKPAAAEDDPPEPPPPSKVVSQLGDVWRLGRHVLVCGDAKDPAAVSALMGDEKADMAFLDPPYNVRISGNVSGLGQAQHREFVEASGEMSREEFTGFLKNALAVTASVCRDGAIAFACMDWRHIRELVDAGEAAGLSQKNLCVWAKTNGGMGAFYRSQHELITVWKVGTAPHTNTFGLGDRGRSRTNVWTYSGANVFRTERMEELELHPTVKPVALVADAIRDVSHRGDIVLDVFGGSGTTLIAAHKTGRRARLVELDPAYCDVIIRRWQKLTGQRALLASTGDDFESVTAARESGFGTDANLPATGSVVQEDKDDGR